MDPPASSHSRSRSPSFTVHASHILIWTRGLPISNTSHYSMLLAFIGVFPSSPTPGLRLERRRFSGSLCINTAIPYY